MVALNVHNYVTIRSIFEEVRSNDATSPQTGPKLWLLLDPLVAFAMLLADLHFKIEFCLFTYTLSFVTEHNFSRAHSLKILRWAKSLGFNSGTSCILKGFTPKCFRRIFHVVEQQWLNCCEWQRIDKWCSLLTLADTASIFSSVRPLSKRVCGLMSINVNLVRNLVTIAQIVSAVRRLNVRELFKPVLPKR